MHELDGRRVSHREAKNRGSEGMLRIDYARRYTEVQPRELQKIIPGRGEYLRIDESRVY